MRFLGIDPSLTSTGLALVEDGRVVDLRRISSKRKGHDRIEDIVCAINTLADPATQVGIEGPAMHAKGSATVQIFGLWGVITHELWRRGHNYYVVTPSGRCRYATGRGNAAKDQVLAAVIKRYVDVDVTGHDVADALVIAAMGARHYGEPLEASLPEANQNALGGVQW